MEQSYKEKYEQALKMAQETYNTQPMYRDWLESMLPELSESEDEKIRKEILSYLKTRKGYTEAIKEPWIDWLEKRGEERKITHEEICKSYGIPDIGEFSDGYHTFNGLYKQRMILFAVLVKTYKDRAWKSWKHEDGLDCFGGGWFIVGIDTPAGTYTYHYEAKDWDRFDCQILEKAKHWDGHDESDVERLFSLVSNTNKDEVIKCLINGMKFYYEDNEEATWGTEKFSIKVKDILSWLEKQGKKQPIIVWHSINEEPEEMKELFCEWESDDATWHDVAFYDKESHTFRHAKMPINVTKWIYVDELLGKQGEPSDEDMKTLLRTEYEKGRADAIAEMQKEWSEEDETTLNSILSCIKRCLDKDTVAWYLGKHLIDLKRYDPMFDWLESLRPQNRWKPSDEQMELLSEVQNALLGKDCHNRFTDFIWELKKLKED